MIVKNVLILFYFMSRSLICLSAYKVPRLLVISLDGFKPEYVTAELMPFLFESLKKGAFSAKMKPQFPTKTLPNHQSIATGLYVESHGIVNNYFYDPHFNDIFYYDIFRSKWWDNNLSLPIWVICS